MLFKYKMKDFVIALSSNASFLYERVTLSVIPKIIILRMTSKNNTKNRFVLKLI